MLAPLGLPLHAIPGNHDDRELLAACFGGRIGTAGEPIKLSADCGALRLVGLDSSVPGREGGSLGSSQLDWLEAALAEQPRRPTLLALHHPPVPTGMLAMDAIGLDPADGERLEQLLERHPQVLATSCGHQHRAALLGFAGRPLLVCPSTNSALRLDLRGEQGLPLEFEPQPLGFAVHVLAAGRLVSHVQPLPEG